MLNGRGTLPQLIESEAEHDGEDINDIDATDFINESPIMSVAEYVRDIINVAEYENVGNEGVVQAYDQYIVFDSIDFSGNCPKRSAYIRTPEDFVRMIAKYLDTKPLTFANVYEGCDWTDPNYWQE